MSKKNVLILTSDAGFGHRRASEAVEAALNHSYGDRVDVHTLNLLHDPSIPDLIKAIETGYDDLVIEEPTLYHLAYAATDGPVVAGLVQRVTTRVVNQVLNEWIALHRPDSIIITYPAYTRAALSAVEKVERKIPVNVIVTDMIGVHSLWFNDRADTTFVPTGNVYRQAIDAGLKKERVQLTGLPVNPRFALETRDRVEIRRALGWDETMVTCIVVGSSRTRQTAGIAQLLDRSGLALQIVAIAGGDPKINETLANTEWSGRVHTYGYVDNMPEMMKASDFIVCKAGGLIVTESLAAGLPLLLYEALPGQESGNVKYVTESGAGDWSPGPIGVLTTAYRWLAGEGAELKKHRAAARKLGKPRAAFDVADHIVRQMGM